MTQTNALMPTAERLTQAFLLDYPQKATQQFTAMAAADAAQLLQRFPTHVLTHLWPYFPAGATDGLLIHFDTTRLLALISALSTPTAVALLSRLPEERQTQLLQELSINQPAMAAEFEELLQYPDGSAGRLMNTRVHALPAHISVDEALRQLKVRGIKQLDTLYILDGQQRLIGKVDSSSLVLADRQSKLAALMVPLSITLNTLDPKSLIVEYLEGYKINAIPVLDAHEQLLGIIRAADMYQSTKEDLVTDIQTMVGAGKEEKALSSPWFAVKKRLPWLQINLLTAFAAASVVGSFESLIAQFTALAILLPVAAGQSGNAGAQALAVTMRGLTLREITTRQWLQVMLKETSTGLMNGLAVALTCALGVWLWSQSVGLALVMALAMTLSLVIACSAGAVVPIELKKLGQDPAQSSSIVLTTVTDIAGFVSFLGTATLMSNWLPAS